MQAPESETPSSQDTEGGAAPIVAPESGNTPVAGPEGQIPTADAPAVDAPAANATSTQASVGTPPGTDAPGVEIFSMGILLPFFLTLVTLAIFIAGLRQSRLLARRSVLLFLALNSFTLTACLGADYHLIGHLPGWLLSVTPLCFTILYLIIGGGAKKPLVWGAGLATPGLWFFAQRLDELYFHVSRFTLPLPQDPAWFLLIGAALFVLMHVARIQKFWDAMEQPELIASFCYAMAGLWLLSLGEASVLGMFTLPVYAWAAILLALAGIGLWVARLLGDLALAICCGLGVIGVLYSFGMYVFVPAAT